MKQSIYNISAVAIFSILVSCSKNPNLTVAFDENEYTPQYATGFVIKGSNDSPSKIITITNPWQGSDSIVTELFIDREGNGAPEGFMGQVLPNEAKRIVAMSSTYIAMLDAIGEVNRIVGVSGIDFITNKTIKANANAIGDVGYDGNINFELLVSLNPDLVLLYGVNGASAMENKLKELKIPYMYVGDYLEESPLGKAEWLVALAEVVGKGELGKEIFSKIPERYNNVQSRVAKISHRPTVMLNAPYRDSWFMPSVKSYIVQLINDAGGEYVYPQNNSSSSMPIDMELAYKLTSKADIWLNVGSMSSITELKNTYPKFANTKPVISGNVFNSNKRTSKNGANDYWESGVVNPDLVLRDLLKIMHPELVEEDFIYYQELK